MADSGARVYTRQEIIKNRIVFFSLVALVAFAVTLIILTAFGKRRPKNYIEQGPVPAVSQTTYLTGRDLYDFNAPVPENIPVSGSYFYDALFVGESHIGGLVLINDTVEGAGVLYGNSASVSGGMGANFISNKDEGTVTLQSALENGDYKKIYLQFGLNELGWQKKSQFKVSYTAFVKQVAALCPDAEIYLMGLLPVSAKKSASSAEFNNENVALYNGYIREIAGELELYFLDVGAAFADETGALAAEYTENGINISYKYYYLWYDYLATHTVPSYVA